MFANRDLVHPLVAIPSTLRNFISIIKLPPIQQFHFSNSLSEIERYANISALHTILQYGTSLLFRISIPLVENHNYNLYKLLPMSFESKQSTNITLYSTSRILPCY